MSNVIEFLERMGSDAHLRGMSAADFERAMTDANLDDDSRAAIRSGDTRRIEGLLGIDKAYCCLIEAVDPEIEG